jgi:aspartyl-tRNA(Asn)/glutamyl-tRNA(Gln) amidotransferase subunit A
MVERTAIEGFGDEPKRRIMLGTYALSAGYYEAFYGTGAEGADVIIGASTPQASSVSTCSSSATSPTVAFRLGDRTADPSRCTPPIC